MTKILVIDDDRDAADSLTLLFQSIGHEVETGYGGEDAVSRAEAFVPHIVFLDLNMPGVNGFSAAQQIRSLPGTEHPFLVALTGMGGSDIDKLAKDAGFDLYVTKPADFSMLIMIVDNLQRRDNKRPPNQL